jgi:hypothetical protein
MPKDVLIKLEAIDTGNLQNGQVVFKTHYEIQGEESYVFSILCDAIHKNDKFKRLVEAALRFDREHDFANCPHCRPKN